MTRKTYVHKTDNPAPLPTVEDKPTDDLEFDEVRAQYREAARVNFRRYDEGTRRWERCGSVPADIATEDWVLRNIGGGTYRIRFIDDQGKFLNGTTVIQLGGPFAKRYVSAPANIGEPIEGAGALENQTSRRLTGSPAAISGQPTIEQMLRAELDHQRTLMVEMLQASRQAPQNSMTELVAALASLQQIQSKVPAAVSFSDKLLDRLLELGLERKLQTNGAGGNEFDQSPWGIFLRDLLIEVRPQLRALLGGGAKGAAGAIQPSSAQEDETTVEQDEDPVPHVVDWLKEQCRQQRPVAKVAKYINDSIDLNGNFYGVTGEMLQTQFADPRALLEMDPELLTPGYTEFFKNLFAELGGFDFLERFKDPARSGGNNSHA